MTTRPFREGDNAIQDLLLSESMSGLRSGVWDQPNPVKPASWTKHLAYMDGLDLSVTAVSTSGQTSITREALFDMASHARTTGQDRDVHALFWSVMAWGVMGNLRNVSRIAAYARTSAEQFGQTLAAAAQLSFDGHPAEAYRSFTGDSKVSGLGPAFFSKYLYFTGDPKSATGTRCYILDERVETALHILTGEASKPSSSTYALYCADLERWAITASRVGIVVNPDEIEVALYVLGRCAKRTTRWLRAELGLHREGVDVVDFESIVGRLM